MSQKTLSIILSGKDELSTKLDAVRKHMDSITESGKPLKRQLREMQTLMADMNLNGLSDTGVFTELAQKAGTYKDAISDAAAATNAFADDTHTISAMTQVFSGLSGMISITSGATSLLGVEEAKLEQVLRTVQGSLALVNGAQAVANALNKDSALMHKIKQLRIIATTAAQKANTVATAAAATTTGAETVAVGASNIAHQAWNITVAIGKALFGDFTGLILLAASGIAIYATATASSAEEQNEQAKATDTQRSALKSYQEQVGESAASMMGKFSQLTAVWRTLRSEGEKTAFLKENKKFLNEVGIATDDLISAEKAFAGNTANVVKAIKLRAQAMAAQEGIMEAYKEYNKEIMARDASANIGAYVNYHYTGPKAFDSDKNLKAEGMLEGVHYTVGNTLSGKTIYNLTQQGIQLKENVENARRAAQASVNLLARNAAARKKLNSAVDFYTKEIETSASGLNKLGLSLSTPATATTHSASRKSGAGRQPSQQPSAAEPSAAERSVEEGSLQWYDDLIAKEQKYRKETNLTAEQVLESLKKEAAWIKARDQKAWEIDHPHILPDDDNDNAPIIDQSQIKTITEQSIQNFLKQLSPIPLTRTEETIQSAEQLRSSMRSLSGEVGNTVESWSLLAKVMETTNATMSQSEIISIKAGAALTVAGNTLKQIGGDGAIAKVGAVMASIGQIILGFASASVQAAQLGPLGWLAFLGAGLAAVATTVSTIKGFADGGLVQGTSYHGDTIMARVNAGEMILNKKQQSNLFRLLDGNPTSSRGNFPSQIVLKASGPDLVGVIDMYNDKMSGI